MSRETKVGLIVAASFLLLVGSVVFYKLYVVAPAEDLAAANAGDGADTGDQKPVEPGAGGVASNLLGQRESEKPGDSGEAGKPAEQVPESAAGSGPGTDKFVHAEGKGTRPPPLLDKVDAKPGFGGRPEPPPLIGERPGAAPGEKPGLAMTGRPGTPPGEPADASARGNSGGPPAPEEPEAGKPGRPGFGDSRPPLTKDAPPPPEEPEAGKGTSAGAKAPPPPEEPPALTGRPGRPGIEEKKPPPVTEERPGAPPAGRPDLDKKPPGLEKRPTFEIAPRENPGVKASSKDEPRPGGPPAAPGETRPEPPLSLPPEARTPPGAGASAPPESLPRKPLDPPAPNAFDRKYDPPAQLGKPTPDPVANTEGNKRGTLVEIRPQPEVGNGPAPSGVRGSGSLMVFDEELYRVRTGDTFASISQLKYRSEHYAEALSLYNRERDPRMTAPVPGSVVVVPPAEYLERKYRQAIDNQRATRPENRHDRPVAYEPNTNGAAGGSGAAKPAGKQEKTYRVRTGDTLWNISKQTLGTGERWAEILRLNRDVLPDINRLQDGLILRLPTDAKLDAGAPPP